MLRVFVCDDSEWFGDLVAAYLEPHQDLTFAGSADDRESAFSLLSAAEADVVLLDTMTYGLDPIRVEEVRAAIPGARVLICSGYPEAMATTIVGAADGYVGKGGTATALIAAIRALAG